MTRPLDAAFVQAVKARTTDGLDLYGQRLSAPSSASVALLLHDRGGDLDSLGWLSTELSRAGFDVASLDLPGHGLTEGDYDRDSGSAIGAFARELDPDGSRGLLVVAMGESCGQLLATVVPDPVGVVLIDPVLTPMRGGETGALECWPTVPTLVILSSTEAQAEADAAELASRARSWLVRAYVPRSSKEADSMWRTHVGSMCSRFGLEQATYRRARRGSPAPTSDTRTRPRNGAIFRKHR